MNAIKSAGKALHRVKVTQNEVYKDGSSGYEGVNNSMSSWKKYMEKIGFQLERDCWEVYSDDVTHEFDCNFTNVNYVAHNMDEER